MIKLSRGDPDDSAPNRAAKRNDRSEKGYMRNCKLVDMEDPAFRGKSMAQVDREVWAKDVAALKAMGVNLEDNHMDGYLLKAVRKEEDHAGKPWEPTSRMDEIDMRPAANVSVETWSNPAVKFEIESSVAYITLARPEANNALDASMQQGLSDAVRILQGRQDIRVVILQAEGRMFCAGGDPKSFQAAQTGGTIIGALPSGQAIAQTSAKAGVNKASDCYELAKMFYSLSSLPQYTICCCQGSAMGGGVGLACACDMTIAVKTAQFVQSEVKLGVIPATISPYVLARIGATHAKRFFCTSESIKAQKALNIGLIHSIVDTKEGFAPVIQEVCAKLQGLAPESIKQCKEVLAKTLNAPVSQSLLEYTADMYAKSRKGTEAEAGMKALKERKKPSWMENEITLRT
jgi:methylglutaconyl-CoA hydratase